jgi:hypothetical protein
MSYVIRYLSPSQGFFYVRRTIFTPELVSADRFETRDAATVRLSTLGQFYKKRLIKSLRIVETDTALDRGRV